MEVKIKDPTYGGNAPYYIYLLNRLIELNHTSFSLNGGVNSGTSSRFTISVTEMERDLVDKAMIEWLKYKAVKPDTHCTWYINYSGRTYRFDKVLPVTYLKSNRPLKSITFEAEKYTDIHPSTTIEEQVSSMLPTVFNLNFKDRLKGKLDYKC